MDSKTLGQSLAVGDIVFVHIDILPFRKIACDTMSWTNHVGIVTSIDGGEPIVSESTFPFSKHTKLSAFLKRSKDGRTTIKRLPQPITPEQQHAIRMAANKRLRKFYDTGFNLASRRQFCSRFVHEILKEALDVQVGKPQNLRELLTENPDADMRFWRLWYFGRIPWERTTVTPASQLNDPALTVVFDGNLAR
ncbi:MAG: YebB family permuted papain-like enzyme [Rickettsiales bacterium]